MPSIFILIPTAGSSVDSPFTASGTYQSDDPFQSVSVVLKDSGGAVVATGMPVTAAGGNWSGRLYPSQGYTGATVEATLVGTAASASVGSITVVAPEIETTG
jgi:hypothetical protein